MAYKGYQCSICKRRFTTSKGANAHMDAKHDSGGVVTFTEYKRKPAPKPKADEDDESFADRAVQAEIDRACGIYNPDQDWLLP